MALRKSDLKNVFVRLFGWRATLLHGDPTMLDRWRWASRRMRRGPVRTLDVGSGSGPFSIYAAVTGNRVTGLSYDAKLNAVARERARLSGIHDLDLRELDLRELDGAGLGRYDQILCLEVIEHLLDDAKLVAGLGRLLEPGGRLLLSAPHEGHRRLFGEVVVDTEDGRHVRYGYSRERIEEIVLAAGLEVQGVDYLSGVVSQMVTNAMRVLARLNYQLAWLLTMPLRLLQPLDRPLTRLVRWPWLSIAVVAVKRP